ILKENGFKKEEIEQLAEEHSNYNMFSNGETLLSLYKNSATAPELRSEIDFLRKEAEASFLSSLKNKGTSLPQPELVVVTGSPGSGKSSIIKEIQKRDIVYFCSDIFKRNIIEATNSLCDAAKLKHLDCSKLENSGYTHGFSAEISWDMFYKFVAQRKSVCVETLGLMPLADTRMIQEARKMGYKVTLVRVEVSQEEAVIRAAKRYLKYEVDDEKRYISLPNILFMWEKVHAAFKALTDLNAGIDVQVYNNEVPRTQTPRLVFHKRDTKIIHEEPWGLQKYRPLCDEEDEINKNKPCKHTGYVAGSFWYLGDNHTGDMIVFRQNPLHQWEVLLIRRDGATEHGKWALPGGFVNTPAMVNEKFILDEKFESPLHAAIRELKEETGYVLDYEDMLNIHQLKKFDIKGRDPRDNDLAQAISNPFSVVLPYEKTLKQKIVAMDDAEKVQWVPLKYVLGDDCGTKLAFDHVEILKEAIKLEGLRVDVCANPCKMVKF
ncbi:MAG: 8-oxo-dGTP diphosphatase, partial [Campylobacterota bacterium]|nr:8-oxo-dGTP diphosphatase [Campylobacterota bacterium]